MFGCFQDVHLHHYTKGNRFDGSHHHPTIGSSSNAHCGRLNVWPKIPSPLSGGVSSASQCFTSRDGTRRTNRSKQQQHIMAPIVLYTTRRTPAGRAVELTAKMLSLELDVKYMDLAKKEQMTPEFLKMNPMHTVPTVNDNGVPLYDSHAIIIYLVSKYGKDDSLYPKADLVKQANINALLHFESGVLFARLRWILEPIFYLGQTEVPQEKLDLVLKAYELLEGTLGNGGTDYLVGSTITLADISVSTSLSTLNALFPADASKYPLVVAYLKRLEQTMPNYKEINTDRANEARELYNQKVGKA